MITLNWFEWYSNYLHLFEQINLNNPHNRFFSSNSAQMCVWSEERNKSIETVSCVLKPLRYYVRNPKHCSQVIEQLQRVLFQLWNIARVWLVVVVRAQNSLRSVQLVEGNLRRANRGLVLKYCFYLRGWLCWFIPCCWDVNLINNSRRERYDAKPCIYAFDDGSSIVVT